MSTNDHELAALRARIDRLEELTRFQAMTLISIWGSLEDPEGRYNHKSSQEIEDSIRKIVDLFAADSNG